VSYVVVNLVSSKLCGGPTRKTLLREMADKANDDGSGIYSSHATLAAVTEIAVSTVKRTLKDLEADGLIVRDGIRECRNGHTTIWRIVVAEVERLPDTPKTGQPAPRKSASKMNPVQNEPGPNCTTSKTDPVQTERNTRSKLAYEPSPRNLVQETIDSAPVVTAAAEPPAKPTKRGKTGERFTATFATMPDAPTATMVEYAMAKPGKVGWVNGRLQDLFAEWRDHHVRAATKIAVVDGLEASWRMWVNNARNKGWGVKPNVPALPESDAGLFAAVAGPLAWTDEWVKRFREWAFNRIWDEAKLGPAPYQPGYRGPEIDASRQAIYEAALRKGCWGEKLGLEAIERHKRNQGLGL
jgi:hypothetical protein